MDDSNPLAVETQDLTRAFGGYLAVNNLSLRVPVGSFYGFVGPNGAGKSTTINMLTGLRSPSGGSARVLGYDLATQALEIKRRIGVVPEGSHLFERLTAAEHLQFVGRLYGLDAATAARRTAELLETMGLAADAGKLVAAHSHGMRKKLALCCALIHSPSLIFLDEPFEGIDAVATNHIRELLARLRARGRTTIFLTSHVLEVVERLCTHIGVIDHGRLVAQGSLDELRRGADGRERSLEERFIELVSRDHGERPGLDWLGAEA